MRIVESTAARLKSMPQASKFYLFVQNGDYVWTGRVDSVAAQGSGQKLKVTTLSGDKTRLVRNMTAWVGTLTSPKGWGRVRLITGTELGAQYIVVAPNSIQIQVGQIISVDRVPRLEAINTYHDSDVIPGMITDLPPQINMGPHRATWTGVPTMFYADQSFAQRGRTIVSHTWDFGPNAIVAYQEGDQTKPGTTLTPIVVRWTVPGDYVVTDTVTDSAGEYTVAWRVVLVRDHPDLGGSLFPYTKFTVDSIEGSYDSGGWTASIQVYEQADKTNFPDAGVVILVADDYYAGQNVQVAGLRHMEGQVFNGYIQQTATGKDGMDNRPVTLTCATMNAFAENLTVWPANFAPASSPNPKHNIDKVTLQEVILHLTQQHSTLACFTDLVIYGLDKRVDYLDLTEGALWNQLGEQTASAQMAFPCFNRYGQLYIHRDANHRTQTQRSLYGPTEVIFDNDWWTQIDLGEVRPRESVAQVDATGVYICTLNAASATNISGVYALYPPLQSSYGNIDKLDGILIPVTSAQIAATEIMEWAQLRYARANIRFPLVTLKTFNVRAFDPAEQNYVGVNLAVEDTLEGWTWANKEFIVRQAHYEVNTEAGYLLVSYGLEDSIWGPEGSAGEYPAGSTGPDYTPILGGRGYGERTGKRVLACWKHGIVECDDVFTAPQNWVDRTSNLAEKLDRVAGFAPRLNGVERDPYNPSKKWWAWGHPGIWMTEDRGIYWTQKVHKNTFAYWAAQQGIQLSADELAGFAVIRHITPYYPKGWHGALVVTRYPGQIGRSRLWWLHTNNDWATTRGIHLITEWLTNPGEYSAANLAHCAYHMWPNLNPYGQFIGWITTSRADRDTVQLWRTTDGGTNWQWIYSGDRNGYGGVYPNRIVVPTAGNESGDTAWWIGSGEEDRGTTWVKITNATATAKNQVVLTRQYTTHPSGPTFGCAFDPPFAVYPQSANAFHSVGYSEAGACWEKRDATTAWKRMAAPPGPYHGFAQFPYDYEIMYIGTNGPFVNNGHQFYVTRSGGASWDDASGNLYQLMTYDGITPARSQLWSICPDPTV